MKDPHALSNMLETNHVPLDDVKLDTMLEVDHNPKLKL
jgi:hypothetical protein